MLSCLTQIYLALQTVYIQIREANWSGSALFAIKYVNLYQPWSSNLIGWKLETSEAS